MPGLILRSGKRAGRRLPLPNGDVILGRDEGCRIRLTSPEVSRRHCQLRIVGREITVFDLESRNGTFVNEMPIKRPTPLRPGDLLRVGPFIFEMPGQEDTVPAGMSDDEVAGWLSEEGTFGDRMPSDTGGDTAFIPQSAQGVDLREVSDLQLGGGNRVPNEDFMETHSEKAPEPPQKKIDPVVLQAAEIIQNYWDGRK